MTGFTETTLKRFFVPLQLIRRAGEGDFADPQQIAPLADVQNPSHLLLNPRDRHARFSLDFGYLLEEVVQKIWTQAKGSLIEHNQSRLGDQRRCQRQDLLLAAAQLPRLSPYSRTLYQHSDRLPSLFD